MRIDITEIAGINGAFLNVKKDIPSSELITGKSDVELGESIYVELKIEYLEGMIIVSGTLSGSYHAVCGRCLANIDDKFSVRMYETFLHTSDSDGDGDNYLYEGHHIELTTPLIDNILLGFPSSIICSEDCKGLCSSCGKNLNDGDCSCNHDDHEINLQMEKLKDFFDK